MQKGESFPFPLGPPTVHCLANWLHLCCFGNSLSASDFPSWWPWGAGSASSLYSLTLCNNLSCIPMPSFSPPVADEGCKRGLGAEPTMITVLEARFLRIVQIAPCPILCSTDTHSQGHILKDLNSRLIFPTFPKEFKLDRLLSSGWHIFAYRPFSLGIIGSSLVSLSYYMKMNLFNFISLLSFFPCKSSEYVLSCASIQNAHWCLNAIDIEFENSSLYSLDSVYGLVFGDMSNCFNENFTSAPFLY